MRRSYNGVIFTNHALQRLAERGIKQGDAYAAFRRPDNSRYAKSKKAWVYYKTFSDKKLEVVASKNEKGEWVILSVWARPVYGDSRKQEKKSFLQRLLGEIF